MPEQSFLEEWVTGAGEQLDKQELPPKSREKQILSGVAREAGVSEARYYELVGGKRGEVPALFEEAAREALSAAAYETASVISFANDRKLVDDALLEVGKRIPDEDQVAYGKVEETLRSLMRESAQSVVAGLEGSEDERMALASEATRRTGEVIRSTELDPGSRTNLANFAAGRYSSEVSQIFGGRSAEALQAQERVPAERHPMYFATEPARIWAGLMDEVSRAKLDRFIAGKTVPLRIPNDEGENVIEADPPHSPSFAEWATEFYDGIREDVMDLRDTASGGLRAHVNYERSAAAAADGIVEGALISGFHVRSPEVLFRNMEQSGIDLGIGNRENAYDGGGLDQSQRMRERHRDSVCAGYIMGLLERGLPAELASVVSMRTAYDAIQNESMREALNTVLSRHLDEFTPDQRLAFAVMTGNAQVTGVGQGEYQKLNREVWEQVFLGFRDDVRERVYSRKGEQIIGKRRGQDVIYESLRSPQPTVERSRLLFDDDLCAYQASEMVVGLLVDLDRETQHATNDKPPITWKDARVVIERVTSWSRSDLIAGDYRAVTEALRGNEYTESQKRLMSMMAYVMYATSHHSEMGTAFAKCKFVTELAQEGYLSKEDIINAHNAALISVTTVNQEFSRVHPGEQPPLVFYDLIGDLRKLDRPLQGTHVMNANMSVYSRGEHRDAVYYSGDSLVVNDNLHTYSLSQKYSLERTIESGRAYIQEQSRAQFEAARDFYELYGERAFSPEEIEWITTESSRGERMLAYDPRSATEIATAFGWGDLAAEVSGQIDAINAASKPRDHAEQGGSLVESHIRAREAVASIETVFEYLELIERAYARANAFQRITLMSSLTAYVGRVQGALEDLLGERYRGEIDRLNLGNSRGREEAERLAIDAASKAMEDLDAEMEKISEGMADLRRVTHEVVARRLDPGGTATIKLPVVEDGKRVYETRDVALLALGRIDEDMSRRGSGALLMEMAVIPHLFEQLDQTRKAMEAITSRDLGVRVPGTNTPESLRNLHARLVQRQSEILVAIEQRKSHTEPYRVLHTVLTDRWAQAPRTSGESEAAIMRRVDENLHRRAANQMKAALQRVAQNESAE